MRKSFKYIQELSIGIKYLIVGLITMFIAIIMKLAVRNSQATRKSLK